MKKIVTIIVLVFAFTFSVQAQKKGGKVSAEKMLAKMTKELSLTDAQQSKIKPLLVAQIAERKKMIESRKVMKSTGVKPTKEIRQAMRKERVAKETAINSKMASILDKDQFKKYEAIAKEQKQKKKKQ